MREYFLPPSAIVEIIVVLVLICSYIWILMPIQNSTIDILSYLFIFAAVSLFQALHRLPLEVQGVRFDNLAKSLGAVGLVTLVLISTLAIFAHLSGKLTFRPEVLLRFWWVLFWGLMQQFLLQSVLQLRIRSIVRSSFMGVLLSALVFSAVHFPNYYLMILSFIGALCWCSLFTRYPNIFALGLSHALLDLALLVIFPAELLGNLKVGPGFWGQ